MLQTSNGGIVGVSNNPTSNLASGVWRKNDQLYRLKDSAWPATPLSYDPYWNNVVYLAGYENNLTDEKGLISPTINGSISYSSSVKKFGSYSLNKPSGSHWLNLAGANNTPFAFGTGDFTIEYWIYFYGNASGNFGGFCVNAQANGNPGGTWTVYNDNNTGQYNVGFYDGSNQGYGVFSYHSTRAQTNTWHHFCVSRSGNNIYVGLNGIVELKATNYGKNVTTGGGSFLGKNYYTEAGYPAYHDEVRITKGVARYTSNYTIPTTIFPRG